MPLAPAIAASLNAGLPLRSRQLFIGGLDVTLKPQAGVGNRYGTIIESIRVTEAGPGAVSSMTFTVDDPQLEVTIAEGMIVRYQFTPAGVVGLTEFLGIVQTWELIPADVGRQYAVIAQGAESWIDWRMVGDGLTIPAGTDFAAAVGSLYANSFGTTPPLNVASVFGVDSDLPNPVVGWQFPTQYAVTFAQPTTLREAIRQVARASMTDDPTNTGIVLDVTVDMYGGLRVVRTVDGEGKTNDSGDVAVDQGATIHEDLRYLTDAGGAIRGVYVSGGNAAGSGFVSDGTGVPGKIATLVDSTILTAAARNAAARAYLAEVARVRVRGTLVRVDSWTGRSSTLDVHVFGSVVIITNTQGGLAAQRWRITQIEKTYQPGGLATWRLTYGGNPPHATAQIRRLTRGIHR